jgi:hypothetical protein
MKPSQAARTGKQTPNDLGPVSADVGRVDEALPGRDVPQWRGYLRHRIIDGDEHEAIQRLRQLANRLALERPPSHFFYMVIAIIAGWNSDISLRSYLFFCNLYFDERIEIYGRAIYAARTNQIIDFGDEFKYVVEDKLVSFLNDINNKLRGIVYDANHLTSGEVLLAEALAHGEHICAIEDLVWGGEGSEAGVSDNDTSSVEGGSNEGAESSSRSVPSELPSRVPEFYLDRHDRFETAPQFLRRIWGRYLDAGLFFQNDLNRLDPKLFAALTSYCQRTKTPRHEVFPPPRYPHLKHRPEDFPEGSAERELAKIRAQSRERVRRARVRAKGADLKPG